MSRAPTLKGRLREVVHRVVRATVCAVLRVRRGPPGTPPPVTFLLANAYGFGGTTRTCLNLAGHLASARPVEVISLVRTRAEPLFAFAPQLTVTPLVDRRRGRQGLLDRLPSILMLPIDHGMQRRASLRTDLALVRALWRVRSGVLISTRPAFAVLVARLRRPGLRTIGQEHINHDSHKPRMRAELLAAYARLDVVAVLTAHDRDRFELALAGRTRVVAIPNAVPHINGPNARPSSTEIVAVGRLAHQKGYDQLIDAFAQVAPHAPGWSLRICGGGERRDELAGQIMVRGLEDRVQLTGPVRRIGPQLARASIYTLSSRFEGLPLAMLEAMSKGLAIVAFDCPTGPGEVLTHGTDGLLIPAGDVDAFAEALLELIGDEQRRRRLGQAARRRATDFSIDSVGRRWAELLAELTC